VKNKKIVRRVSKSRCPP